MLISNFIVLYDTNVLYPLCLRDFLIRLAMKDLYRAKWSEDILDELKRNLLEAATIKAQKLGIAATLSQEKIERTISLMNNAVQDCLVTGYQELAKAVSLPDPSDNHVLAAAIKAKASLIVTLELI